MHLLTWHFYLSNNNDQNNWLNAVLEKEANAIADETETGYESPAEVATNTATENRNTLEPDAMVEVSNQSSTPPLANRIAALFGLTQVSGI